MTASPPHDPYITAVAAALTAVGLPPTRWTVPMPHDGLALDAVLRYARTHPAVEVGRWPDGVQVTWSGTRGWQWQEAVGGQLTSLPIDHWADPLVLVMGIEDGAHLRWRLRTDDGAGLFLVRDCGHCLHHREDRVGSLVALGELLRVGMASR
jgi:hypothetical protein